MKERWFVLDLNPEPWGVGPLGVARRGGRIRPFMGRNDQLDDYKKSVKDAVGEGHELIHGKVKLTCLFWRHQTEYETPSERRHRKHEADATNMLKATEDALQGVLYVNDKDNNEVHAYIIEQGPDVKPRVVICVEPGDAIPDIVNRLPAHVYDEMDKLHRPYLPVPDEEYNSSNADPRDIF